LEIMQQMPLWSTFAQAVVDRVVEGALHAPDVRSEGVRFAVDSPVEGGGFEPSVPLVAKPVVS
jgi:hypothetical protein